MSCTSDKLGMPNILAIEDATIYVMEMQEVKYLCQN